MGYARVEDRYSGELRILKTQTDSKSSDPHARAAHMQIFLQRPKVQSMNRPAVRNVQVVRTERDLARARRGRAEAARRRKQAASRRARVATVLLGVTVGVAILAAATSLSWLAVLAPLAALAGATVMGSRAAARGRDEDRAARRRIAELERQLNTLEAHVVRGGVTESVGAPAARSRVTAAQPVETVKSAPAAAEAEAADVRGEDSVVVEPTVREKVTAREDVTAREEVAVQSAAEESAPVATETPASTVEKTVAPAVVKEPTLSTPPQGWSPVVVPAPTYTLAAQAPRREYAELNLPAAESAKVPMRPTAARPWGEPAAAEQEFHPIDLEAVLERRRAAGA